MTGVLIRPATAADVPAMTAIYAPAVRGGRASWEYEPPDVAEMTRRHAAIIGGGYPYLVAEIGGAVAGYAYASGYRARIGYRWTVEDSIYVAQDAQGRGVGRALLMALIRRSEAAGFRQMLAVIGDSANVASTALHRRAGFTFCGTLHGIGFKHGRWLDSVLMQRALGDGETTAPDGA